ncbi:MAG: bifunctional nuclease family protein [Planctomycetota bacterium]
MGQFSSGFGSGGDGEGPAVVRMELARIIIRETEDAHQVELRESDPPHGSTPRTFPIVIGLHEAAAIERRLMGEIPMRPQTHELLAEVVDRLDFSLDAVVIHALRDHTFFAKLVLRNRQTDHTVEVDSRPSDALALGAADEVPVFVAEEVLTDAARAE